MVFHLAVFHLQLGEISLPVKIRRLERRLSREKRRPESPAVGLFIDKGDFEIESHEEEVAQITNECGEYIGFKTRIDWQVTIRA